VVGIAKPHDRHAKTIDERSVIAVWRRIIEPEPQTVVIGQRRSSQTKTCFHSAQRTQRTQRNKRDGRNDCFYPCVWLLRQRRLLHTFVRSLRTLSALRSMETKLD